MSEYCYDDKLSDLHQTLSNIEDQLMTLVTLNSSIERMLRLQLLLNDIKVPNLDDSLNNLCHTLSKEKDHETN